MTDPTEDLFDGLDRPRALPGPLRDRLEQQLLSAAGAPEQVPLGAELDERLHTALTDPVAAALTDLDVPRALSPELRAALTGQLVRRRRNAQRFLGAAAVVVLAVALAVVLGQSGPTRRQSGPASASAPAASALPGDGTAAGGVATDGTSGGSGTGSPLSSTSGHAPAALPPGAATAPEHSSPGFSAADRSAVGGVSPDSGPVGGGTTVTVHGHGLSTAVQVYFGKRPASSYAVVSDTTVRAVTPAAAAPGSVDVVVVLSSGGSYRLSSGFSYLPRPAVSSLSPSTGRTSGGTWVSISGTALSRVTAVSFGGTVASRVVVVSDSELRALSPQHPAGPVDVTVTTPGGTSATNPGDRYTYLP